MFVSTVYLKVLFVPLFEWERGVIEFFQSLLSPCAVANLLEIFEGSNSGCKIRITFHVRIIIKFD